MMIASTSEIKKGDSALSHGEKSFTKLVSFYATPHTEYPVERATLFGFDCLRINGKVFAKLHNGHLVMKLPANRITALVESGQASSYELRGRLMKEWGVISTSKDIVSLAEEARAFTESGKS
ncbi:MAG TPA: hypothetical protein VGK14_12050 [Novimethylophilus sp.]|jgi:hypothetical protein|uniref:hypothetical protein n=1 Tax=Novimethylophilus sp. TaxID=2137426 RepID=UPI002F41AF76